MLYLLGNNKNMNIQDVIKWLQTNEVDGETMENIIREVGMEDQMLRQLIMKAPIPQVQELVYEKTLLELGMEIKYDDDIFQFKKTK